MGRPRRQTGHLSGTFPPPTIKPNQGPSKQRLSSCQPLQNHPRQPQVSIPIRQGNWQPSAPQYSVFLGVEEAFTPSTTDALSPVSTRATLSPRTTSATASYTGPLECIQQLSPDANTPSSSTSSDSRYQNFYHPDHVVEQSLHSGAYPSDYVLVPIHPMRG